MQLNCGYGKICHMENFRSRPLPLEDEHSGEVKEIEKEIAKRRREKKPCEVQGFKKIMDNVISPISPTLESRKGLIIRNQILERYGFSGSRDPNTPEPWKREKIGNIELAILRSSRSKEPQLFLARINRLQDSNNTSFIVRESLIFADTRPMAMEFLKQIALQEKFIPSPK